jgi:hypothetical protein
MKKKSIKEFPGLQEPYEKELNIEVKFASQIAYAERNDLA